MQNIQDEDRLLMTARLFATIAGTHRGQPVNYVTGLLEPLAQGADINAKFTPLTTQQTKKLKKEWNEEAAEQLEKAKKRSTYPLDWPDDQFPEHAVRKLDDVKEGETLKDFIDRRSEEEEPQFDDIKFFFEKSFPSAKTSRQLAADKFVSQKKGFGRFFS